MDSPPVRDLGDPAALTDAAAYGVAYVRVPAAGRPGMAGACEACWGKAFTQARMTGRHQSDVYAELIAAGPRPECEGRADDGS
ncbi:hypothetical protein DS6A_55 [Mycobacterium phage DS6A]|uniref:Uncharacterized protein n=1 Tax=Mycobacterium phage DS6A TaxID=45764 RepID=G8I4G5_9CAUD|nr:hypothetical protein DS6A_55 [Mycobacterium phage DS6A]AER47609.1 hypothetical protein DS6A_55 [Mycobacterium phage DS6A]